MGGIARTAFITTRGAVTAARAYACRRVLQPWPQQARHAATAATADSFVSSKFWPGQRPASEEGAEREPCLSRGAMEARVRHLKLPANCVRGRFPHEDPVAFLVRGVISEQEAEALMAWVACHGAEWSKALVRHVNGHSAGRRSSDCFQACVKVNVGHGREQAMDDVRQSDRKIIDDVTTAAWLWQRMAG